MPALLTVDGTEYDKTRIVLYAYRHTYAQRHADAGVGIDVLRELMDHRRLDTTKGYYQVGQTRRREAVDRVTAMQFDRHGNRIWQQAQALLDSQHTRRLIGEVVVPFGICTEPSNVKAGGRLPLPVPLRRLRPLPHRRLLPPRPAHLPRRPAPQPEKPFSQHRYRRLGTSRGNPIDRGDHQDPPADRPHHHRSGRPHPGRPQPHRARRHRSAPPPRRHPRHARHPPTRAPPTAGAHPMTPTTQTAAMAAGRRADTARRRERVLKALRDTDRQRRGSHRQRHRPARRNRPHIPLPAPGPPRTGPRRRGPPTTPGSGRPSAGHHCRPTYSPRRNAASAWPRAPNFLEAVDRPLPIRRRRLHRRDLDAVMHSQSRITRNEPNIVLNVRVSLRLPRRAPGVRIHTVTESFLTSSRATGSYITASTTAPFPASAATTAPGNQEPSGGSLCQGHRPTRSLAATQRQPRNPAPQI